jgi:hypothetical protein
MIDQTRKEEILCPVISIWLEVKFPIVDVFCLWRVVAEEWAEPLALTFCVTSKFVL